MNTHKVELTARYSNNPTLLDDLRNAREAAQSAVEEDDPELGGQHRANGRRWALAYRMAPGELQAVVDGYWAGRTARELAERFQISESSVKRLLRRAGCRKRGAPPG